MPLEVARLIIGPTRLFSAPVGESVPSANLAYGAAWPGSWVHFGFTSAGLNMVFVESHYDHKVQQYLGTVKRTRTDYGLNLETTISEFNLTTLSYGMGGTVAQTSAGASQVGFDSLKGGGTHHMGVRAYGFEGMFVDDDENELPIRVFLHKANSVVNGNLNWAIDEELGIPFQVLSLVDLSKVIAENIFEVQHIIAPATS